MSRSSRSNDFTHKATCDDHPKCKRSFFSSQILHKVNEGNKQRIFPGAVDTQRCGIILVLVAECILSGLDSQPAVVVLLFVIYTLLSLSLLSTVIVAGVVSLLHITLIVLLSHPLHNNEVIPQTNLSWQIGMTDSLSSAHILHNAMGAQTFNVFCRPFYGHLAPRELVPWRNNRQNHAVDCREGRGRWREDELSHVFLFWSAPIFTHNCWGRTAVRRRCFIIRLRKVRIALMDNLFMSRVFERNARR